MSKHSKPIKIRPATLGDVLKRLPDVEPALRHLQRVTGKWNVWAIDPLSEDRWSETCWKHYKLLKEFQTALRGENPEDVLDETARLMWKDVECAVTEGTWSPFEGLKEYEDKFAFKPAKKAL